MTTSTEVTDLFSRLAQTLIRIEDYDDDDEDKESINLSISKLNKSLNLNEDSRFTVLETSISLMCFEASKVFDSVVDYSVKTIASVLSASISSQVLRFGNEQVLWIGSSIPLHNCEQLVHLCIDILEKLRGNWMLSQLLLGAVVRVAVSASCYQLSSSSTLYLEKRLADRSMVLLELLCYLPRELSHDKKEIPLRLLFWYLDPLTLKHDVSKILQGFMKRPFMCLREEFHENVDWRAIVICLALSPHMFIETRTLLHGWFLLTGLASILELLIGLVSVILDINVTPTLWGISMELGSRLPFTGAYFPNDNHLLRTFAGPLTTEGFLHLVHATSKPVFRATKQFVPTLSPSETKVVTVDHRSIWALAISFPGWFYFASMLLFSSEKGFERTKISQCTLGALKIGQMQDVESISAAAARYIAWILSPNNKSEQEFLAEYLNNIAEAWTLKLIVSGKNHKEESLYQKKPKKPKFHDKEDCTLEKEYYFPMIRLWLDEIQSMYMQYSAKTVKNCATYEERRSHGFNLQRSIFFRRIPLGILLGYSNCIKEEGCELLLHYSTTGRLSQFRETDSAVLKHGNTEFLSKEDLIIRPLEFSKREAVAGACLVFGLTDIVESMLGSLAETEERASDFICQLKLKTGKYLIKCIRRLIQVCIDEAGVETLLDLSNRLVRWRHQGQDVVQFDKDLDEVTDVLSKKLSPI